MKRRDKLGSAHQAWMCPDDYLTPKEWEVGSESVPTQSFWYVSPPPEKHRLQNQSCPSLSTVSVINPLFSQLSFPDSRDFYVWCAKSKIDFIFVFSIITLTDGQALFLPRSNSLSSSVEYDSYARGSERTGAEQVDPHLLTDVPGRQGAALANSCCTLS